VNAPLLGLFALGTFAPALLAPLVRRLLGERGALALTVGGLALVRLAIQWTDAPLAVLVLATAGLVLFGWFLPLWLPSRRNRPTLSDLPVLAIAFPLAFLLDTGSRTWLLSYDLAWRHEWWAGLIVIGLAGLTLVLLWRELADHSLEAPAEEPPLGRVWPFLGLGPWLYLAMAILHNPSAWAAITGWSDVPAHLVVNACGAMGALGCVLVAAWQPRRGWFWALLAGGLLVGALALFTAGIGPGGLWLGLATLAAWAALGWVLAGTAREEPLRPGIWRSGLVTFLALLLMLVIVFVVSQYNLAWVTVVAGAVLLLAATWAARGPAIRERVAWQGGTVLAGAVAIVALLTVALLALADMTPRPVATPPAGQPLRVMTYNIHQGMDGDFRIDLAAIAEAIAAENPDVVALNEVNRARSNSGFVDTLPLISRRLGLPYVFGANSPDGQYGNAVLSRYPIREWRNTLYTHNTTEVRGLLRVVIEAPGGPITFYSTHLDHIDSPKNARAAQAAEALAAWAGAPRSILLGDLNAEPGKPELQAIYQTGFVDVLKATGQDNVFTYWDPIPTPGRRIDYIFVTPDLAVSRAWVPQTRASDHLPVLVEIAAGR
jgi:endonuclease/exonuclease/phosphatase family metal-dependent hydrolase